MGAGAGAGTGAGALRVPDADAAGRVDSWW